MVGKWHPWKIKKLNKIWKFSNKKGQGARGGGCTLVGVFFISFLVYFFGAFFSLDKEGG